MMRDPHIVLLELISKFFSSLVRYLMNIYKNPEDVMNNPLLKLFLEKDFSRLIQLSYKLKDLRIEDPARNKVLGIMNSFDYLIDNLNLTDTFGETHNFLDSGMDVLIEDIERLSNK